MTEPTAKPDYRSTVFLPKTDFPMKAGLPQKEPGILAKWQAEGLYEQTRAARAGRDKFILHDGPPYANGDIHVGHALNHVLKDMVVRTQTLLGKDAPYVPGWDCHGLPIEWKVEEEYRKKKLNKDEVPPQEFRAECRAYAAKWVNVQREQLKRLGIGGDWDHPYLTMDFASEATIVAELMKFAESGQLYRGAKPVMWSPVEKTALAEAEIEYEDIVSTQIDVAFEITESPIPELVGAYAVIWTTTPWTIPVNQAIAYGPEMEYVLCNIHKAVKAEWLSSGRPMPLAGEPIEGSSVRKILIALHPIEEMQGHLIQEFEHRSGHQVVFSSDTPVFTGSQLAGTIARHPLYNLFAHPGERRGTPDQVRGDDADAHLHPDSLLAEFFTRPRRFLAGDFVTTDAGTGLVHMAPDHGEDDFYLCKANGIEPVFAVEGDGRYSSDWAWMGGNPLSVINPKLNAPDGPICTALRDAGALLAASDYRHSYPHSWRSKAKVIYRCTPQWFVPMDRAMKSTPPPPAARAVPLPDEPGRTSATYPPQLAGEGDQPQAGGGVSTLRQTALAAIAETRFVPDKGRNRIGAMVEGRPDWVLSRQRAWGVPITLFVDRRSGQYLVDAAVNARIVAAIGDAGVDAWSDANAQGFLGDAYDAADYERVTDILDVWFDSGSTHAFVLESGRWPDLRWPADLYLEGSDQHRGWFQSSLLESCATRGRAPYNAVLTHGFTMDAKGFKMSKSLGNTISPLKVMEQYGADIIRLWALSVDYTEDHRIGDEILKGVADQYRKLRNTFRYLLGALDGFDEAERIDVAEMPELERYVLALLARLDATLRQATADFDFNTYVRALVDFCNEDLSAFYFDIRKDILYCEVNPATGFRTAKHRACRTVLDTLFHALVRYAAPVLVFTAEEVWGTRLPDGGSVHLLEWLSSREPEYELIDKWLRLRGLRSLVSSAVEVLRRDKRVGSSLEAVPEIWVHSQEDWLAYQLIGKDVFVELCIVADLTANNDAAWTSATSGISGTTHVTTNLKCGRCWRHLPEVVEDADLCNRCTDVLANREPAQ